jgi:LuxR family maltose regulon positive regulatory protein
MVGMLLETKLFAPPPRPGVVVRDRLLQRLNADTPGGVTLVSAPAGFGKTTLLAEVAADPRRGRAVAWFSVDRLDDEASVFWAYLIEAVDRAIPGVGASARGQLSTGSARTEAVLSTLINDVHARGEGLLLVLDDYHLIEDPAIQSDMAFLVEHLPPQVHLLLGARADPALPLARLRATGRLAEVRAADLRFSADEAAEYLNGRLGLELDDDAVAALEARTEGWIAALQLAGLSLQDRPDAAAFIQGFAGDDRFVVDYLAEEVLQRQPDEVRRFLLQTSILERLTGPLCDAVTDSTGGSARLTALDRANLFLVPLDDQRRWYRYHHLFADVLRARLLDERPAEVPDLHRRASDWFEADGDRPEAVGHALAARDWERAAALIELATPEMQRKRRESTLRRWMRSLPDETFETRPVLAVDHVGALMSDGTTVGVESLLARAERWLGDDGTVLDEARVVDVVQADGLAGAIARYRAALALTTGDLGAAQVHAERALALADADDHLGRGAASALMGLARWAAGELDPAYDAFAAGMASLGQGDFLADVVGGAVTLADIRIEQGRLGEALRLYEDGLALAIRSGGPPLRGAADMHVGIAAVATERGDLETAVRHLAASRDLGDESGLPKHPWRWRLTTARVRQAEGDLDGALRLIEDAEPVYTTDFSPDVRPIQAVKARTWIVRGDLAAAGAWARSRGLDAADAPAYLRAFEEATFARLLLARGIRDDDDRALADAASLAERLRGSAEAGGRYGSAIDAGVVLAVARHRRRDLDAALEALDQAFAHAEPEGHARNFLDEGEPMVALLRVAAKDRPYAKRLLAMATTGAPAPVQGLIEPLSERELEVLRLLQGDLSGPEIAGHLFVSVNTLRTHTKNIYAKLGVTSRRAAVSRAAELGLLRGSGMPTG